MRRAPKPEPKALGWREAADEYGISRWAMYRAYSTGAIANVFSVNRKMYAWRSDIEAWLRSQPQGRMTA